MPKGELFINGKDAYVEWGLSMETGGLSALMTPPPNKELIENKSRLEHGKRVIASTNKLDERDLNLPIHITAISEEDFMSKYSSFCEELKNGKINITTKYRPNEVYRTNYMSCTQFSQFRQQMAKFTLKLNEPNPYDRSL